MDERQYASIKAFLQRIGIPVEEAPIDGPTFLPGILVDRGRLVIDRDACLYIGDILHEAGHIAVLAPEVRCGMSGTITGEDGEMATMLWSYAAALELGLDPAVVFHSDGYKGDSEWLLEQYAAGNFIGMPLLQWMGLARDPAQAAEDGPAVFPAMMRWLRA